MSFLWHLLKDLIWFIAMVMVIVLLGFAWAWADDFIPYFTLYVVGFIILLVWIPQSWGNYQKKKKAKK